MLLKKINYYQLKANNTVYAVKIQYFIFQKQKNNKTLNKLLDIFKKYPNLNSFKSPTYSKYRANNKASIKSKFQSTILANCDYKKVSDIFFQTGVWILTKNARDIMMPFIERYMEFDGKCDDGQFLNWAVIESGVPYQDMDPRFNVKNNGLKKGFDYNQTYFLHSAGGNKYLPNSKIHSFLKNTFPEVILSN